MYSYMSDGQALLRHDPDKMTFECYQGGGHCANDVGGPGTYYGWASDAVRYDPVDEVKAQKIMKEIDARMNYVNSPQNSIPPEELYKEGCDNLKKNNFETAIDFFNKIIESNPSRADAWHNLGVCYGYLGRYDDALICFDHALKLKPDDSATIANKGIILIRDRQFDIAIPFIQDALLRDPKNLPLRISFINLLTALGQYEEALRCRAEMPPVGGMTYMLLGSLSKEFQDVQKGVSQNKPIEELKAELHGKQGYEKPEKVKVISLTRKDAF
jgi:tetratricopeptide (TPR) repeat protein